MASEGAGVVALFAGSLVDDDENSCVIVLSGLHPAMNTFSIRGLIWFMSKAKSEALVK